MPYAIRKVREEIVTEEMVEAAHERFKDAYEMVTIERFSTDSAMRMHRRYQEYLWADERWFAQQRELADGTLVLETTEGESR